MLLPEFAPVTRCRLSMYTSPVDGAACDGMMAPGAVEVTADLQHLGWGVPQRTRQARRLGRPVRLPGLG